MNDITKPGTMGLSTQTTKPRGLEENDQKEDIIIPRVKMLQKMSPEVDEDPSKFRPGMLINSISKEILPGEFIPVIKFTEWIKFNAMDANMPGFDTSKAPGELIYRTSNPFDEMVIKEGHFGPNGEKPTMIKFLNFLSWFPGTNIPLVVSFCKTSLRAGKTLLSLARFSNADLFSRVYSLTTKKQESNGFTYHILEVAPLRLATESEFKNCEQLYNQFSNKAFQYHVEAEPQQSSPDNCPIE